MPMHRLMRNVRSPQRWQPPRPPLRIKRRRLLLRRLLQWAALVAGIALLSGVFLVVAAFAWYARDLPDPHKIKDRAIAQSTQIFDRTGEHLLYQVHGDKKRTVIAFDEIPDFVKKATIVAEDKDFYRHRGFDLRGILRALLKNIIRLDPHGEGGSTITQQFVKNSILTPEKTYTRKVKELVLAYQIEKRFTKDEILGLYFNEIPYGSNAYGIEAAAETYFSKHAKDLTLAESAVLASLPRAPTYYSPYGSNTEALDARQQAILDGMAREGYITTEQAEAAKAEKLGYSERREGIIAPHFVFYVRELLAEKYGETAVEQGGYKVITTLDLDAQRAAEDAITEFVERNEKNYRAGNAALVAIDAKTGQILAMVGSRDYFDTEHDGNVNVTVRPRQPGSSFKPFVYLTAFERGYTPETMVFDLVTNFATGAAKPYTPHNYDNKEHGPLSLRKALAGSLNIPAVKTLYLAGVNNVLDTADRFGYTTLKDRSRYGLSLVLGGGEVKLLEHVGAFATLAREGLRHPATPILRLEDKSRRVVEEFRKREVRVADANAVRKVTSILTDNEARSFIFGSRSPLILSDRVVAAKTGTTNDFRDAWALGYTPSLAAGVWVGNNDNSEMKRGADGVIVAAPIWHSFMQRMTKGKPVETFKAPEPDAEPVTKPVLRGQIDVVRQLPVDRLTGNVIPESCRDTYPKQYVKMRNFKETHEILHWVDKENPRGAVPANPETDPQYKAWEGPVRAWAAAHGYKDLEKLNEERCDLRDNPVPPSVTIEVPAENAVVSTPSATFTATASSPEQIADVTFSIDDVLIDTVNKPPYTITYTNRRFGNGAHTLKVVATDALGNAGAAARAFTYALAADARYAVFLSPQANAVFKTSDFPLEVKARVFDPAGLQSVQLLANGSLVDAEEAPPNDDLTFVVVTLPVGSVVLELQTVSADGTSAQLLLPLTVQ